MMKSIKIFFLTSILLISIFLFVGCWNYREVDDINIVAGTAIDKGIHKEYMISIEILESSIGKESPTTSKLIVAEGESIFDAVRNAIAISGKKLYWSHNKILILSKEVAQEGITEVIDWFLRDAETRSDVYILVSKGTSAKEILEKKQKDEKIEQVVSFNLHDILVNQKVLSKAPNIQIWQLTNDIVDEGIMAIAPSVELAKVDHNDCPEILGTAFFKNDQLIGFLSENETKYLLFLRNQIKGGLLNLSPEDNKKNPTITFEIFDNKTKLQPVTKDKEIAMNINIDTHLAVGTIKGTKNYLTDKEIIQLEKDVADMIKTNCENLIKKMQSEYKADIFGFGAKIRAHKPAFWKDMGKNWENVFENLEVHINVNVGIINGSTTAKPLEVGD
ncbi:MAG TPA: Ger(x)C family spore germination protein [Epulopiscium sp.]|nr:Ger(x)C family spore germination protein [Candidatus Epulonipiscium sp.]